MTKQLFSNGRSGDYVLNPFLEAIFRSTRISIAAPYVTKTTELLEAAKLGKFVQLLVELNAITDPHALKLLQGLPNVSIRFYTAGFHAKIFVFDDQALVGSSNLTEPGLSMNREATLLIEDIHRVQEVRDLFNELWEGASVLTDEALAKFSHVSELLHRQILLPGILIEGALGGRSKPPHSSGPIKKSTESKFLEQLRRRIYEGYRPAFIEVMTILGSQGFRRPELADVGPANETNRFLNWVRLVHAPKDLWNQAPFRSETARRELILTLGADWTKTSQSRIPEDFVDWVHQVRSVFGSPDSIEDASQSQIGQGLLSLHAFSEQLRFVKGGTPALLPFFWEANGDNLVKVRKTLTYLIHGSGEFVVRLHSMLDDPEIKLRYFGLFCGLELFGTIKPDEFPPVNGRMAKALRFLGYDVSGS